MGVAALISDARSAKVVSISCPIPVIIGTRLAAIARTTLSSLKVARSSALPPPRTIAITSGRLDILLHFSIALTIDSGASLPWT